MEPKAPPSTETSLKFMAWDVKKHAESTSKMADSLSTIASTLVDLNNNIKIVIGILRAKPSPKQDGDLPPF